MIPRSVETPDTGQTETINLSLGQPCYEPPSEVRAAAAAALLRGGNGYLPPGGLPELRSALAEKLRNQNRIATDADQVIVSIGASLGLFATIAVLCRPGDAVLIPDPCFPLYRLMLETQRLRPLHYALKADKKYEPDWESLESQARDSAALIWNFPSNPLGIVARRGWLRRLYELLANHPHLFVISDEVYEDLLFSGKHHSPAAFCQSVADRVFSIFSFSKSYAMTGWRVGYVHAPRQWAPLIERAHWGAAMSTPTIAQYAAAAALRTAPSYHAEIRNFLMSNRTTVLTNLRKWNFHCTKPEAGFFIWVNIAHFGLDSLIFANRCGEECGVLVSPSAYFSPRVNDHVRICFAVDTNELTEGIERLGRWAGTLYHSTKK